MVRRMVLLKLVAAHATDAGRAEVIEHTRAELAGLEGVRHLWVGAPADAKSAAAWDVALVLDFESVDDIERYRVDPVHRRYVDDFLAPRLEVLKAWNFAA